MLQDTNQILQKSVILFSVRGVHACVNGNDALINWIKGGLFSLW
jgi:hypothetical protein